MTCRRAGGRALVVAALALTAAGCVGTFGARGTWIKPGNDPETGHRDAYECEREAVLHASAAAPAEQIYERCMRERGYVRAGGRAPTSSPGR